MAGSSAPTTAAREQQGTNYVKETSHLKPHNSKNKKLKAHGESTSGYT